MNECDLYELLIFHQIFTSMQVHWVEEENIVLKMQAVHGKQLNIMEWADLADEKPCSNLSLATSLYVTLGKALNIPRPFAMMGKVGLQ